VKRLRIWFNNVSPMKRRMGAARLEAAPPPTSGIGFMAIGSTFQVA
jgi:hypothetical protein